MASPTFAFRLPACPMAARMRAARSGARGRLALAVLALIAGALAAPTPAAARCIPVAQRLDGPVPARFAAVPPLRADLRGERPALGAPRAPARPWPAANPPTPALPGGTVELTFLGHSSFLIRTRSNVTAITDYNGYIRAGFAPDIVTMNRAHDSHYTDTVEPGVKHILRGWMEKGVIPRHDVTVRDLRVTNVPTNIRGTLTLDSGLAGNSIFIFESAGLCIVHLGHLHHRLRPGHASRVGSVDVLLAPIDDSYTMPQSLLVKVIDDLKPSVVIPMHYGYGGTLERFAALMRERKFAVVLSKSRSVRFTKLTLPERQTFLVLQGGGY